MCSYASLLLRAACGSVALASVVAADLWTVGPAGSGAQFSEIQAAIDAARDGDVILVRAGGYRQIVVDKPLRILGDGADAVRIGGNGFGVRIRDIGQGEELVLSGMTVRAVLSQLSLPTIALDDCPGTVVLQGIVAPASSFTVGVQAVNCARAFLLDCDITGGVPGAIGAVLAQNSELWIDDSRITGVSTTEIFRALATPGVEVIASTLHVWRSRIRGGDLGTTLMLLGPTPRAPGIRAVLSTVEHFGGPGAEVSGGMGVFDATLGQGLPGGSGVDLIQNSSARFQADISVQGGANGGGVGQAPAFQADASSSFTLDPRVFPTLASSAQRVQLGSSLALGLSGNPGGFQVLFVSLRTGPTLTFPGVSG